MMCGNKFDNPNLPSSDVVPEVFRQVVFFFFFISWNHDHFFSFWFFVFCIFSVGGISLTQYCSMR